MSNHFHILASTPDSNIDAAMNYFMRESSRAINRRSGRIDHVFGKTYKPCVVMNALYFAHALKYIYQNPIRAEITDSVEKYPFSSLKFILGQSRSRFPLFRPIPDLEIYVPQNPWEWLAWLNRNPANTDDIEIIRRALRKKTFEIPLERVLKRGSQLHELPL